MAFKCRSGKHTWTRRKDAKVCCDGVHVAVRIEYSIPSVDGLIEGRAWVKIKDLEQRGDKGVDPNCWNCKGTGGMRSGSSCIMCWSPELIPDSAKVDLVA